MKKLAEVSYAFFALKPGEYGKTKCTIIIKKNQGVQITLQTTVCTNVASTESKAFCRHDRVPGCSTNNCLHDFTINQQSSGLSGNYICTRYKTVETPKSPLKEKNPPKNSPYFRMDYEIQNREKEQNEMMDVLEF